MIQMKLQGLFSLKNKKKIKKVFQIIASKFVIVC